jgi:hypothetical protein
MYILYNSSFSDEREGAGAVYQRIISLLGICRKYNLEFMHHKQTLGHNYLNENDWDDKWDNFFNLKKICKTIDDIDTSNFIMNKIHIMNTNHLNYLVSNKDKYELNYFENPHEIIGNDPNSFFSLIQRDLIEAYDETNINRPLIYKRKSVAIHIRVWNEFDTAPYECFINGSASGYSLNESYYMNLIEKIKKLYPDYDIHIFTQKSFYLKYPNLNYLNIHVDMNAFDTFHHLIKADVLVLGSSSFSYIAGIYNSNTVIYTGYFKKALNSWIDDNKL